MQSNPILVLTVLAQMLRALASSTVGHDPYVYMPVPADNVTVSGLQSDVQMIFNREQYDITTIKPVDPRGIVIPMTTFSAAPAMTCQQKMAITPIGTPTWCN